MKKHSETFKGKNYEEALNKSGGEFSDLLNQVKEIDVSKFDMGKDKTKLEQIQKAYRAADRKEKVLTIQIYFTSGLIISSTTANPMVAEFFSGGGNIIIIWA